MKQGTGEQMDKADASRRQEHAREAEKEEEEQAEKTKQKEAEDTEETVEGDKDHQASAPFPAAEPERKAAEAAGEAEEIPEPCSAAEDEGAAASQGGHGGTKEEAHREAPNAMDPDLQRTSERGMEETAKPNGERAVPTSSDEVPAQGAKNVQRRKSGKLLAPAHLVINGVTFEPNAQAP